MLFGISNKIIIKRFFSVVVLLVLSSCQGQAPGYRSVDIQKPGSPQVVVSVSAEFADTFEERMKGLMFRNKLGKKEGMLFIFDRPTQSPFWMKNTPLPLDMIFIDEAKQIVDIVENTMPYSEGEIWSRYPYQYNLEVNAGFVKKHRIERGDKVVF